MREQRHWDEAVTCLQRALALQPAAVTQIIWA
jgi:hypothetical protein